MSDRRALAAALLLGLVFLLTGELVRRASAVSGSLGVGRVEPGRISLTRRCRACLIRCPMETLPVKARIVDPPEKVNLRRGFLIRVKIEPDTSQLRCRSGAATLILMREALEVSLSLAGAEVSPEGQIAVDDELIASWSVKASDWGTLTGIISGRSRTRAPRGSITLALFTPLTFEVTVRQEETLASILAPVAYLLGLATSATALVVFWWKWRDRRATTKGSDPKPRPVLYGPDDRPM